MKRYLNQKDDYSCGPIAIVNAFKWLGYSATTKDLIVLRKVCELDKDYGVTIEGLNNGLKYMCKKYKHPKIRKTKKVTIKRIEKLISQGKAVLVDLGWMRPELGTTAGHYFLIHKTVSGFLTKDAAFFRTINGPVKYKTNKVVPYLVRTDLAWILKHRQSGWPTAWILNEK